MIRLEHLPADTLDLPPLAREILARRSPPAPMVVPHAIGELPRMEERFDSRERASLAKKLEAHLAPLAPHVAVLDALRSLESPQACAVVTGQQPGLFTSPLYSLYKALQAIRLAALLRKAWDVPVIALFWNHADDHDVAEVHHAHLINANLDLQKIGLSGLSSGKQPLSRIVLDEERHHLSSVRALVSQTIADQPFAERALATFFPRAQESFAHAFTRSFTDLLGPLGLVVLEPDWIREDVSLHLSRIVARDPARQLAQRAEALRARGIEPAIDPQGAALLYSLDDRGRRALRAEGEGFKYDDESGSRTASELAAEIVQAPLEWSPGALLRPIVQDLCLPVAAYIGGWGELAYHVELTDLRNAVEAPQTPFVPRISCTLTDPECRQAMTKSGTDVAGVLRARGAFATARSEAALPEVIVQMRERADRAAKEMLELSAALAELDPSLVMQLKRTADQMRSLADKMAEKAERVHQNKSGTGKRHERRLNNALQPRGLAQERVLGPLQFVARFGEPWIGELCAEIDPFAGEHLVVHLGSDLAPGGTT